MDTTKKIADFIVKTDLAEIPQGSRSVRCADERRFSGSVFTIQRSTGSEFFKFSLSVLICENLRGD